MATTAQKKAAKKNIVKAQKKWKTLTKRQHSLAQPEGRARKKPGTTGKGEFYRIVVRPKSAFTTFRVQDVGRNGHTERLAGKRSSGSWDTVAWFISKRDAHISAGKLVIDSQRAKTVMKMIRGPIVHSKGDVFTAKPRKNVPERAKPTLAQRRARATNIRTAQKARELTR
ncbi:MAG: hypothetical protein WBP29_10890 [Candidatus Zixiibacteriota bacterium]